MPDTNIKKLYSIYFVDWLLDAGDVNLLSLGDWFDERILNVIVFKDLVSKEVSLLSEDSLARLVGGASEELNETDQAKMMKDDATFRKLAKTAPAEVTGPRNRDFTLWALGLRPRLFADFDFWGKFDEFSLDELVWLSTGLDPRSASLEKELLRGAKINIFPLAEMERRRTLIARAFPKALRDNIKAVEFHNWGLSVGLKWHAGFHVMINSAAARVGVEPTQASSSELTERTMQPLEFRTAARIIAAIAIDAYGHVPNQKRSPTTKDILDACHKAGLSVTNDTILKYLRAGTEQIEDQS
jgi:hypothetical protein